MLVKDIERNVALEYVKCSDSINRVRNELIQDDVSAQIVVNDSNEICGIITIKDILKLSHSDFELLTAKDICSSSLFYTSELDSITQASKTMLQNKCHHLLITDGTKENIRGILSSFDIVNYYACQ
jgi:signal-transduction protein with cAMP-binding, CBS, and nucleotidyltransferase domain